MGPGRWQPRCMRGGLAPTLHSCWRGNSLRTAQPCFPEDERTSQSCPLLLNEQSVPCRESSRRAQKQLVANLQPGQRGQVQVAVAPDTAPGCAVPGLWVRGGPRLTSALAGFHHLLAKSIIGAMLTPRPPPSSTSPASTHLAPW